MGGCGSLGGGEGREGWECEKVGRWEGGKMRRMGEDGKDGHGKQDIKPPPPAPHVQNPSVQKKPPFFL